MPKSVKNDLPATATSFWTSLEKALKKYDDSAWLGRNSPLATPYFLGLSLGSTKLTEVELGQALKQLFQSATETIMGKDADRYQSILTEYYFHNRSVGYMLPTFRWVI